MVVTRRGTCASSSAKNISDETESLTESASTIRQTRRRTLIVAAQTQSGQTSDSQPDETEKQTAAPVEPVGSPKRETRSSHRRLTNKLPDRTHEADVSESESCCSEVSDVQTVSKVLLTPRDRRRATRERSIAAGKQEVSEAESHTLKSVRKLRKSTGGQKKLTSVLGESTTSHDDDQSEAESCSSLASLSKVMKTQIITRSRKKISAPPEDAGHSEVESCSSSMSGSQVATVRKSMRIRAKPIEPIPFHLEQSETNKPPSKPSRTRGHGPKAELADEDKAYDSEGCQSGPSLSPWKTTYRRAHAGDSDSEPLSTVSMSLDSPSSLGGSSTPASNTSRIVRVTLDVLNIPSVVSKNVKMDSTESEVVSKAMSDGELSEVIEEEAFNKTAISAARECSISEDTEAPGQSVNNADAETVQHESTQAIPTIRSANEIEQKGSGEQAETVKDIVVIEEIANASKEVVQKAHLGEQSSVSLRRPEKCISVTEEDVGKTQQSSDKTESKESMEEPAVKNVMENTSLVQNDMKRPSFSPKSQESEISIQKSKPKKGIISLLDSSEDESDDEGLLEEQGCKQGADDMESEADVSSDEKQPGPSRTPDLPSTNGLFVIDTRPGLQYGEQYYIDSTHCQENDNIEDSKGALDDDFVDEEDDDEEDEDSKVLFTSRKAAMTQLSSSIDPGFKVKELGGLYINFDGTKSKPISDNLKKLKAQKNQVELLKKSVISADFEKKDAVPPYKESKRVAKKKRKEERAKTTGNSWFDMRAPELTKELKNDLKVLQMRSAMDPKRFYKKNDREGFPKYFQVGTVVDDPLDFYHSRIPKKARKRTMVEELLADAEFRSFNKRKYQEIMTEKAAEAAGKMNKKHKVHKKK